MCKKIMEPVHEAVWAHENQQNKKSEWGITQLSFPLFVYFPAAAYVDPVKLIYLNDLLNYIKTLLLWTNQGS